MELLAQELVHHKELHDRVDQVDDFNEEIRRDQIVAQVDARAAKERLAEILDLVEYGVARFAASRIASVLIDVVHNVLHDFLLAADLLHRLVRMSRLD